MVADSERLVQRLGGRRPYGRPSPVDADGVARDRVDRRSAAFLSRSRFSRRSLFGLSRAVFCGPSLETRPAAMIATIRNVLQPVTLAPSC